MKRRAFNFLTYLLWSVCVSAYVTLSFILPDFLDNPISCFKTLITIFGYIVALGIASFWIIYLTGLNRKIACFFLPIFSIGGATVSYFRVAFHATITPMIIDATLHTNTREIADLVTWQLFVWIFLNLLISIIFVIWRLHIPNPNRSWLHAAITLLLLLAYYNGNPRLHKSINQRYPYNIVSSFAEYIHQQKQRQENRRILPYKVVQKTDSLDIVFILGEAVRADHLQLNGYERQTTPCLSAHKNIVSFPHIYSTYTHTSASVPFIVSPADSLHTDRVATHCSFIRILDEIGFKSAWISNQDMGQTYVSFMYEADTMIFPNASKSVFVFDPWYDEQLLPPLDTFLSMYSTKRLIVLHTIGSHWNYNEHVPPQWQIFRPLTTERIITGNSIEQICNSYDNTVLYMDYFVNEVIKRFETRSAILIYLSDHGEALGENGVYMHATNSTALHHPACFIWYSDAYSQHFPEKIKALYANKDKRYRTDFLYHSILSASGIHSDNTRDFDIFTNLERK